MATSRLGGTFAIPRYAFGAVPGNLPTSALCQATTWLLVIADNFRDPKARLRRERGG